MEYTNFPKNASLITTTQQKNRFNQFCLNLQDWGSQDWGFESVIEKAWPKETINQLFVISASGKVSAVSEKAFWSANR